MDDVFSEPTWSAVRALAEGRGVKSDTVMKWRQRGDIPAARRLELASEASGKLRDVLLNTRRGNSDPDTENPPMAYAATEG